MIDCLRAVGSFFSPWISDPVESPRSGEELNKLIVRGMILIMPSCEVLMSSRFAQRSGDKAGSSASGDALGRLVKGSDVASNAWMNAPKWRFRRAGFGCFRAFDLLHQRPGGYVIAL